MISNRSNSVAVILDVSIGFRGGDNLSVFGAIATGTRSSHELRLITSRRLNRCSSVVPFGLARYHSPMLRSSCGQRGIVRSGDSRRAASVDPECWPIALAGGCFLG